MPCGFTQTASKAQVDADEARIQDNRELKKATNDAIAGLLAEDDDVISWWRTWASRRGRIPNWDPDCTTSKAQRL